MADQNRSTRVFASAISCEMVEDHSSSVMRTWPQLLWFCRGNGVEFVAVELCAGASEEQSTRKDTLVLWLDGTDARLPSDFWASGAVGPNARRAGQHRRQGGLRRDRPEHE